MRKQAQFCQVKPECGTTTFRDSGTLRSMLPMSFSMLSAILLSSLAALLRRPACLSSTLTWAEACSYLRSTAQNAVRTPDPRPGPL